MTLNIFNLSYIDLPLNNLSSVYKEANEHILALPSSYHANKDPVAS